MRVTLISHNACSGEAIGNQSAGRCAFFRDRGAEIQLLVESDQRLHPEVRAFARVVSAGDLKPIADEVRPCDLLIADYGRYYPLLELLPAVAGTGPRILLDYHGVTPPELWDGPAEALREGQRQRSLVWYADQALVHSRFMQRELCDATGYPVERVHVMPLWFDAARIGAGSPPARLRNKLGLDDKRIA